QEQDPFQRALPQVGYTEIPAVPGRSLFLTIDKEIQYFTEQTLAAAAKQYHAESGTAIVMRVRTGEILAMANVPDFDPNNFSDFSEDAWKNRAVTDQFEPGSVFKMITAAAALEENLATPETVYSVPDAIQVSDRVINDSHPHPTEDMTFTEVIAQSSNVGTIKIGLELGKVLLDKWVRRFGFGKETGLDFPGEGLGQVLELDSWYGSTISQIPIGQGVAVTPIQLVTAYATLGNGGMWVEPKLVHATLDADGGLVPAATPARRRVLSQDVANQVLEILTEVVENGTGLEAAVPGYRIAGKTGTAQKPEAGGYGNSYIASFAGVAPSDHPNIAVLVSLDDPSPIWGGSTAAPTFQKIVAFTLRQLGVAPTNNAERDLQELQEGPEEPVVHD
ncbi:MAG: penicillin-binding protein 2, partial [Actinobacteria bacterium]|nr:penicillin-binding protein 2 [Actinomycetota bacterium]